MIRRTRVATLAIVLAASAIGHAHDGPPFPIVSDQVAGAYLVSVWTDPDTTDDGSPGGQFWVRLHRAGTSAPVPVETRATVSISPHHLAGPERSASASPVRDDVSNQFAAVVMDREGHFAVRVTIQGPLGAATVDSVVEATYDLRPSRSMMLLYLAPFILIGGLWGRMLVKRRL